jgi:hypothetical protein
MIYHIEVFFSNNVVLIRKGIKHQYIQEFIYFFMFTIIKAGFFDISTLKTFSGYENVIVLMFLKIFPKF